MQKFKLLSIVLLFVLLAQPIFAQNRSEILTRLLMQDVVDALKKQLANFPKQVEELPKENASSNLKNKDADLEEKINNNIIKQGKCGNNATWILTKDLILTISGSGAMNNYEENGSPWNKYREKIQQVYINEGITSVGNYAFYQCDLCKLKIASTVTSIGEYAFAYCNYLAGDLNLSEKLTYIGNSAFACTSLLTVRFYSNIDRIRCGCFWGCHNLVSVYCKYSIGIIELFAFLGCDNLVSVHVEDSIDTIELLAFSSCTRLREFIVNNCQKINSNAFHNCIELDSIKLPYGTQIEERAFPEKTKIIRE